jgi:tetrahydrodipicolinate N-succinyltransferase
MGLQRQGANMTILKKLLFINSVFVLSILSAKAYASSIDYTHEGAYPSGKYVKMMIDGQLPKSCQDTLSLDSMALRMLGNEKGGQDLFFQHITAFIMFSENPNKEPIFANIELQNNLPEKYLALYSPNDGSSVGGLIFESNKNRITKIEYTKELNGEKVLVCKD